MATVLDRPRVALTMGDVAGIGPEVIARAWADLVDGCGRRELWLHLGWQDIKQRYRRSVLGPFWITIGTATTKMVTVITPFLTLLLVFLLVRLINGTKIGMAMRAVSKDFETARLMGIKIDRVISVTFVIGSFLAAVGSILYFSNYTAVTPTVGAMPGLKAFVAAVFGGIGSIPGAVIGAFIIGIAENIIKAVGLTTFSDAFTFALLIIVLIFRPTGLFGEATNEKV